MISVRKQPTASASFLSRFRNGWIGLGIFSLGWIAIVAIHAGYLQFTIRPSLDFLIVLALTNALFYFWVRGCSQWPFTRQIIAIAGVVTLQAGLHQLVRLDGFAGDGRPIWTWRWLPSPQETTNWEQRRAESNRGDKSSAAVALTATTSFDSPAFRGPARDGRASTLPLESDWQLHPPKLLWKQTIGAGWSSFAVVGDFAITQEQRDEHEATVCYELKTGRECWAHYDRARFAEATSGEGPRATPAIHAGHVYALGATGILNCLEGATGKVVWSVNILSDNNTTNLLFGVTGSPLIVNDLVIVNPGGKGSSLSAYDLKTGERKWRAGTAGASYSSPQFAKLAGVEQILDFNADGLFASAFADGEPLWNVPWISNPAERNNVGQPVILPGTNDGEPDCVFIASGYGMGCALLEVRHQDGKFFVTERWRNRNLKAKFSSAVVHQGYAYGLDDAILTCVELATGKRCWKAGRYGYGQLILADDKLVVQLESGEIALVQPSPEAWRELGRFRALDARTWNHPVVIGRLLLARNDRQAVCYELPAAE